MNSKQEASTPNLTQRQLAQRVSTGPLQLSLSLFPSAPGRLMPAATLQAGPAPRLRQTERAGDSQRPLPMRGLPSL